MKEDNINKRERKCHYQLDNSNYKQILMRYSNSPSPLQENSNKNYHYSNGCYDNNHISSYQQSDLNMYQHNTFNDIIQTTPQNNTSTNNHNDKISTTSYTKYGSSLRYSNTSCCWTNISSNDNSTDRDRFSHSQFLNSNTSNLSNLIYQEQNKFIPSNQMTRNKKGLYDYIPIISSNAHDNYSDRNQYNQSTPFQSKNNSEPYYNYPNYFLSTNNNDTNNNIKQSNIYQRIPIRSKLLQKEYSIQPKISSSHSPSIATKQLCSNSSMKTNSTGIGTFEDSHFINEDKKKKGKIETIEEMHFAFVNMIQYAKQLMIGIEDKQHKEHYFDTASDMEEKNLYYN